MIWQQRLSGFFGSCFFVTVFWKDEKDYFNSETKPFFGKTTGIISILE